MVLVRTISSYLGIYSLVFINQSLIQPLKDKRVIQDIAKNGIERKATITSQIILKNETLKINNYYN